MVRNSIHLVFRAHRPPFPHLRQADILNQFEGCSMQQINQLHFGLYDVFDLLEENGEREAFLLVKLERAHQQACDGFTEDTGK